MECAVTGPRMESGAVCSVIATSCSFVRYTQQIGHLGQVSKDWDKLFLTLPLFSRYLGANDNWILIPPEAAQNPYCRPSQSFQEPSMMCTTSPARCQGSALLHQTSHFSARKSSLESRHNIPCLVAKSGAGTHATFL